MSLVDHIVVRRVMPPGRATGLIGTRPPVLAGTVSREVIAHDAETDAPVYAYLDLGERAEHLRKAVLGFSYDSTTPRTSGLANISRTFGYAPRRPVYGREGCKVTKLAAESPQGHLALEVWADILRARLDKIDPGLYTAGAAATQVVAADWKLGTDTYWTSGVINQSASLPYHRDGFNFQAWSAMPVFRRHMRGGYLSIPEYGAVLPCRDRWAVFFPGWQLVHGVTPMRRSAPGGYRYSVVYYSLRGMKDCFSAAQETEYALRRRTEREADMAARLKAGDLGLRAESIKSKASGRLIGGRDSAMFDTPGEAP